jgi:hypothetical protein
VCPYESIANKEVSFHPPGGEDNTHSYNDYRRFRMNSNDRDVWELTMLYTDDIDSVLQHRENRSVVGVELTE